MSHTLAAAVAATFSLLRLTTAQSYQPYSLPFNTSGGHGPDGPWNYITLNVGTNPSSLVDFYPMFVDHSQLLVTSNSCPSSSCISPAPNYYNGRSASALNDSIDNTVSDMGQGWFAHGQLSLKGSGSSSTLTINERDTFSDTPAYITSNMTQQLGNIAYTPVSLLSVEPWLTNDVTKLTNGSYAQQQTMFEAWHNQTAGAPNTISIHMGSSAFNQSGSVWFGGYDQNRVVEKPAVFPQHGTIELDGMSFGVSSGAPSDPWSSLGSKPPQNFLSGPLQAYISPSVPNLQLPATVCTSMSNFLPIQYDRDSNLYLWNTSSPVYKQIISSPSYHLDFAFGDSANTTIRIPFALLDLTLTVPVKNTPTQYFPCESSAIYVSLGRAFLQGAVVMQSYNPDQIILAQAPGPAVNQTSSPPSVKLLTGPTPAASVASNAPKWEDTWAGFLPLDRSAKSSSAAMPSSPSASDAASTSTNSSSGLSSGLSTGGIVGLAVCLTLAATACCGFLFWFLRRRMRKQNAQADFVALVPTSELDVSKASHGVGKQPPPYVAREVNETYEMNGAERPLEMAAAGEYSSQAEAHEMADTSQWVRR